MKLLSKTLALSVAFSTLLICAPVAHAADAPATSVATTEKFPAAVIAVVDIQRILKESAAAKSLREQLSPRQQAVQKQIATEEDKLRKEQLDLMQQRSKMSDEQFSAKISEFQKKAGDVEKSLGDKKAAVDEAFSKALATIRENVGQIVANLANQRGANVVLDKSQVVVVESALDITTPVLTQLNQKLPKVDIK